MLQIHASAHEFQSIKHRAVSQNSSVLRTRADHSTDDWSLKVLDGNDSGAVSLEEFVNGIIRMKGSTQSKHMFFVHSDLHTLSKRVFGAVDATHIASAKQLDCTEHMETLVRDMWILMQKQATNRWSSDLS